ncbi:MAG: toll/interleukin-1 receptor domain-containing protein, partial [Chloroflexi bacterium]|nr:toll/interleukin-1 receptor domain-containing protein [Chloroflexota bacterium]
VGKIEEGLATSTVFVMLLSTAFNESQWCTEEYRSAVSQAVESGRPRLIPVLREDCDVPALVVDRRRIDLRQDDFYDTAVEELLNAIYGISPRPSR